MLKKIYSSLIGFVIIFIASVNFAHAAYWEDTKNTTSFRVYIDTDSIYRYNGSYVYTIKYVKDGKSIYTQIELKSMKNQPSLAAILSVGDKYKEIYEIPIEREYKRISSEQAIYNSAQIVLAKRYIAPCSQEKCISVDKNPYIKNNNEKSYNTHEPEPDFGPYMRNLQSNIKRNWYPPKGNESKRVVLLFKIAKDGRLLSCSVFKSSGKSDADDAAIKAVKLSAPFRPLPKEFKGQSIDIQFTFDYNLIR